MRTTSVLLLAMTSTAYAEEEVIPANAWYPRISAGLGIGFRIGDLGPASPQGANLMAQLEVKVRPELFVAGTFDLAPGAVAAQTAQLALRRVLYSIGEKPSMLHGDVYGGLGIAREWNRWQGGALARD